jgi:hypothetical protein
MNPDSWVAVANCGTGIEADMMVATLAEAGIGARVKSVRAGIFGQGFGGYVPGGFTIMVPAEDAERARDQIGADE